MKCYIYTSYKSLLIIPVLGVIVLFASCKSNKNHNDAETYHLKKAITVDSAAVVSAHPLASEIGLSILKKGGNAADAAIAVQFALAVCYPIAGNIAGGGFMIYREENGNVTSLDFREKAPALAHRDMYLDAQKNIVANLSTLGALAVGVPGTVDGMVTVFNKYSKLKDWNALVQPSVELAEKGFPLTQKQAKLFNENLDKFKSTNHFKPSILAKKHWEKGDLFKQTNLAKTLRLIATHKRDGFYKGEVASLFLKEMEASGGIISQSDLDNYQSKWRNPVHCSYKGHDIYSMPPPSSGGIALCQLLGIVEPLDLNDIGFHSAQAIHLMVEAERRVYADRSVHLGDPDFYRVPMDSLLNKRYLTSRREQIDPNRASKSQDITTPNFIESLETTHYSIIDSEGNAASVTTTLNGAYGSKLFVKGAGFLLNNEMDDFSSKPGTANLYGLVGGEANKIEPHKRMLSSMTPTIVANHHGLEIVVGSPGGSTIITSVFQTIMNILEFEQNADQATSHPRFHHQWKPDVIKIEAGKFDSTTISILKDMGHNFNFVGSIGKVETIYLNSKGNIEAAADHRGDDHAAGY